MFSEGKAHPVQSSVEDAVELGQENISQNPQGALGGKNVHCLETTKTKLLVGERVLERER